MKKWNTSSQTKVIYNLLKCLVYVHLTVKKKKNFNMFMKDLYIVDIIF